MAGGKSNGTGAADAHVRTSHLTLKAGEDPPPNVRIYSDGEPGYMHYTTADLMLRRIMTSGWTAAVRRIGRLQPWAQTQHMPYLSSPAMLLPPQASSRTRGRTCLFRSWPASRCRFM